MKGYKMSVQIPTSIESIHKEITQVVNNNPSVNSTYDIPGAILDKWESQVDHELFHQDIERFIGDLAVQRNMSGKFDCTPYIR